MEKSEKVTFEVNFQDCRKGASRRNSVIRGPGARDKAWKERGGKEGAYFFEPK